MTVASLWPTGSSRPQQCAWPHQPAGQLAVQLARLKCTSYACSWRSGVPVPTRTLLSQKAPRLSTCGSLPRPRACHQLFSSAMRQLSPITPSWPPGWPPGWTPQALLTADGHTDVSQEPVGTQKQTTCRVMKDGMLFSRARFRVSSKNAATGSPSSACASSSSCTSLPTGGETSSGTRESSGHSTSWMSMSVGTLGFILKYAAFLLSLYVRI
mmetsp:Transcript_111745/g.326766  ORF Transcript_111745/g.326766 Transcript_111745/m.326766 type:complete len:212 (+) Transcript_111745:594-1229(+)